MLLVREMRDSHYDMINIVLILSWAEQAVQMTHWIVTLDDWTPGLKVLPVTKLDGKPFLQTKTFCHSSPDTSF